MHKFEIIGADAAIHADIVRRFEEHNRAVTSWGAEIFSVVLRRRRHVSAAARGIANMGLVEVRGVWVDPELRGTGTGRAMMERLEEEALRRGCSRAALDTYSWQAIGFYERLGYLEYGVLDYPNGTSRHFLVKELV